MSKDEGKISNEIRMFRSIITRFSLKRIFVFSFVFILVNDQSRNKIEATEAFFSGTISTRVQTLTNFVNQKYGFTLF